MTHLSLSSSRASTPEQQHISWKIPVTAFQNSYRKSDKVTKLAVDLLCLFPSLFLDFLDIITDNDGDLAYPEEKGVYAKPVLGYIKKDDEGAKFAIKVAIVALPYICAKFLDWVHESLPEVLSGNTVGDSRMNDDEDDSEDSGINSRVQQLPQTSSFIINTDGSSPQNNLPQTQKKKPTIVGKPSTRVQLSSGHPINHMSSKSSFTNGSGSFPQIPKTSKADQTDLTNKLRKRKQKTEPSEKPTQPDGDE